MIERREHLRTRTCLCMYTPVIALTHVHTYTYMYIETMKHFHILYIYEKKCPDQGIDDEMIN